MSSWRITAQAAHCQQIKHKGTTPAASRQQHRRSHLVCPASGPGRIGTKPQSREEPNKSKPSPSAPDPKYVYSDPINRAFSNLLPRPRDAAAELAHIDWEAPKARGLSLDALAARIEDKLGKAEWFVTGEVDPTLFADDFAFKDESVSTRGIKSYATGVRSLFCQESARAELISVVPDKAKRSIVVTWRLEGRVNLPLRPTIPPYVVTTTLGTNAEGLIDSQLDEFGAPGWRLLAGALLGAWAGPPPAPPVEELRAAARAKA